MVVLDEGKADVAVAGASEPNAGADGYFGLAQQELGLELHVQMIPGQARVGGDGPQIQRRVQELWEIVSTENLAEISDWAGFKREFRQLFGFDVDGVDYDEPVEIEVGWGAEA